MVWETLGAFWQTTSELSCAFYWEVASVWALYHKGLIGGLLQRWLSFWKFLPSPQRNSGVLSEWTSGFWLPPWPRPSPPIAQFGWPVSYRKSLGGHCVLGDLQCCRHFSVPFPRSVPQHNPGPELYGQFLRLHGLFFALTWTVNCGTLNRQVCAYPDYVQSIEFTTGGLQSSCRNIKDDQWKQDAPELNFECHSKRSEYLCNKVFV